MRPILSFLTTANHRALKISHSLAFSTLTHHNRIPNGPNHQTRRHEEGRLPVSVWWDLQTCDIPLNADPFRAAQNVSKVVLGIGGPLHITAFGDAMLMSRTTQEALSINSVLFRQIPRGYTKRDVIRRVANAVRDDLRVEARHTPPPMHIFLISGDVNLAGTLHELRLKNFNILVATPDSASNALCPLSGAATIRWQWSSLIKGEDLMGKLVNLPPNNLYMSWYDQYNDSLEDSYAMVERQSSCLSIEESAEEKLNESPSERGVLETCSLTLPKV